MAMPPPVSKLDVEEAERLPDRLPLQPHGFEGGLPVPVVIDVGDLAVPHLELSVEANVNLDAAGLAAGRYVDGHHDVFALLGNLLPIESMRIPGVEPLVPVAHSSLDAEIGRVVLLDRIPLDLRMEGVPERFGVVLEGPEPPSQHFDVLGRHRLLPAAPRLRVPRCG